MSSYVYVFKLTSNSILHAEARSFSCLEQAGSLQLKCHESVLRTAKRDASSSPDKTCCLRSRWCRLGLWVLVRFADGCLSRSIAGLWRYSAHSAQHVQPCIRYSTWPEVGPKSDSNVLANGDMISDIQYTLK